MRFKLSAIIALAIINTPNAFAGYETTNERASHSPRKQPVHIANNHAALNPREKRIVKLNRAQRRAKARGK